MRRKCKQIGLFLNLSILNEVFSIGSPPESTRIAKGLRLMVNMGKLKSLLRKPKVKRAVHLLDFGNYYSKQEIVRSVQKGRNKGPDFPENYVQIKLTAHAYKRWNERIGPHIGYSQLERLLNQLLLIPNRITMNSNKRAMIDSDILFVYEIEDNEIHIITFIGRASEQPVLQDLRSFRELKFEYNERLNLGLTEEALMKQQLPCIPVEYIHFDGRTTSYFLEKYKFQDGEESSSILYVKEVKNSQLINTIEIDPDYPYCPLLNRSVMHVLCVMGYTSFVQLHLEHHKPEEVKKAAEKYEQKARERAIMLLQDV